MWLLSLGLSWFVLAAFFMHWWTIGRCVGLSLVESGELFVMLGCLVQPIGAIYWPSWAILCHHVQGRRYVVIASALSGAGGGL